MLLELTICNFALIPQLEIRLDEGLTIISGETGAGKSIFLDALAFIGGQRASRDLVRKPADKAQVYALFQDVFNLIPSDLQDRLDLTAEDLSGRDLLLYREIDSKGRSLAKVNGRPVTIALLRELGNYLVNLHAQNEQISLFEVQKQAEILDAYCSESLDPYKAQWVSLRAKRIQELKALKDLGLNPQERDRKLDLLAYQIQEISAAFMAEQALKDLEASFQEITEIDRIQAYSCEGLQMLDPDQDHSALNLLSRALSSLQKVGRFSPRLAQIEQNLAETQEALHKEVQALKIFLQDLEEKSADSQAIRDRMEAWDRLDQKYGPGWDQVSRFYEEAKVDYAFTRDSESHFQDLRQALQKGQDQASDLAQAMHEIRLEAGAKLSASIKQVLADLQMPGVDFQVQVKLAQPQDKNFWAPEGRDQVEFFISTNYGEDLLPLAKVASGGEASRILLAIKSILADLDAVPLLIFDEIDTGISGQAAHQLGEKLRQLGRQHQVIAVTHTAQIAAMADQHLYIYKELEGDRTVTKLQKLDLKARQAELARLLTGSAQDEKALALAGTLLQPYNRHN